MSADGILEILLVCIPGLENELFQEVIELGFAEPRIITGGVVISGNWSEVRRANLWVRGASRVLVRIGSFRALHLAQLAKRANQFPWKDFLADGVPVRVEATCRKSRIYHSKAAAQRIENALKEVCNIEVSDKAELCIKLRIEDDLATISVDSSGEGLHKRGNKQAVGKAPMRETMAALLLRRCGYNGTETVVDPMCGSGTFVIEAAEWALGFAPGRNRQFAFELLKNMTAEDPDTGSQNQNPKQTDLRFYGSDRDEGAIAMCKANAKRAGVEELALFTQGAISNLQPPPGEPGLVFINPPYGARIGDKEPLFDLHASLGRVLMDRFGGWRVGLVTTDVHLAKATKLPFKPPGKSILHGGLKVFAFQTQKLA